MAFQSEVGSGTARATSYHDLFNKQVSFLTSRHVATVVINNGGTGGTYVIGDIINLTHAGAHLDAKFEVLTVSAGQILTMQIVCSGAFGDRPNGTITISAGGTAYGNNLTDLILEIQGGTSRCPAKVQATTNGSGVVTSAIDFEDLGTSAIGVYSSLPSYPAATTIQGPNATAVGTGCTITMGGSTGIIGTTGLAVTGGGGAGATVDITLAETGWTVDGRNTNDRLLNSIGNEKTVVLKGDSAGTANKPFIAYITETATSGLNTRFGIHCFGMIAHNPALDFSAHTGLSPNIASETSILTEGAVLLCSEDTGAGTDEMDFWFKADDQHFSMITQIEESAAVSDNGVYMQHYAGFMDRIGTEVESSYPMFIFASGRLFNTDPTVGSFDITGMAEVGHNLVGCAWYYDSVSGAWFNLRNYDGVGSVTPEDFVMFPVGIPNIESATGSLDKVVSRGARTVEADFFEQQRTSATKVLRKIPGTVDQFFLWPLTVSRKEAAGQSLVDDKFAGQLKGVFWISSDDGTGSRIANFSEDFITVSGVRYLVFHNHVNTEPYQYIAFRMDV